MARSGRNPSSDVDSLVVVSDIHLGYKRSQTAAFLEFLVQLRSQPPACLVINGDLFDLARSSQDDMQKDVDKVIAALRALASASCGVAPSIIYVVGNHDTVCRFCDDHVSLGAQIAGVASVIHPAASIRVCGKRFMITHGDLADLYERLFAHWPGVGVSTKVAAYFAFFDWACATHPLRLVPWMRERAVFDAIQQDLAVDAQRMIRETIAPVTDAEAQAWTKAWAASWFERHQPLLEAEEGGQQKLFDPNLDLREAAHDTFENVPAFGRPPRSDADHLILGHSHNARMQVVVAQGGQRVLVTDVGSWAGRGDGPGNTLARVDNHGVHLMQFTDGGAIEVIDSHGFVRTPGARSRA